MLQKKEFNYKKKDKKKRRKKQGKRQFCFNISYEFTIIISNRNVMLRVCNEIFKTKIVTEVST